MLELVKKCEKCKLCRNQRPLLDTWKECKIVWVGLSAKRVSDIEKDIPLSPETNSGALICDIESNYKDISTYKTNLVKCLPLDDKGKLRYPNNDEINVCFTNLMKEIEETKSKVIFLLGEKVVKAVERNLKIKLRRSNSYDYLWSEFRNKYYVPVHHPSYIYVYKRKYKQLYIEGIRKIIDNILMQIR